MPAFSTMTEDELKKLPKLKSCNLCGSPLEYWDEGFVACIGPKCSFTVALDDRTVDEDYEE